ncbi:RHS repeat-associated core domain-containing protein [Dyella tabacisoli]|uniref:RHS repeat-associated core domain-containing protein n=1 Tax=Dyella tabacisoli TaxID=2282381 RepID=A0A369USN8_9GAMM|nr:RHS repeat-associated core domain-containing protein [Dyella tabacisoli]RDD83487.1 RHS repeat-associated core domain-containing protein [Dyella tabacisoli]
MRKEFCRFVLLLLLCGVAQAQQHTVTYIYTDPQGTPLAEADASGNITATFDYRPYGSQALGDASNGPGYAGHVSDPDTGLVYMQARYYDPAVGRLLSADAITLGPGNIFSFNDYGYANNNPVMLSDPSGNYTCNGSDGECRVIRDAVRRIHDAIRKLPAGSKQRTSLQSIAAAYGKEGGYGTIGNDRHVDVQVNFSDLGRGVFAETQSQDNGQIDVTLNLASATSRFVANGNDVGIELAAVVVHEGQHVIDQHNGVFTANTFNDTLYGEMNAFRSQSYVNEAYNAKSYSDLWNPSLPSNDRDHYRQANVVEDATSEAFHKCPGRRCP